ncbi:MAG: aldehyde dehydrogenase family protein [Lentisphaeria bacterium]|nr:aldehyde dehydrogenase family protein [Lentisphaeria bacterium]
MKQRVFHSYVGGELVSGGELKLVENPATEGCCGGYTAYTAEILDRALGEARRAFAVWSRLGLDERLRWMRVLREALEERREEIIGLLVAETGKPLDNAEYDYGMLPACLDFFAAEAPRLHGEIIPDRSGRYVHHLIRHPVGVVVGFLAWNFPLLNLGYKLGPVLASGCTCILKPSRNTPLATALVGEILASIGFPRGVVNLVLGEDRELADRLLSSEIPAMITMIGSTEAGCGLVRASATSVKRYSLELGGNAPVIVYPDFDAGLAADRVVALKLANTGQVCVSPNRCFVHRRGLDAFLDRARSVMSGYHFGSGPGPGPRLGPVMTKGHLEELLAKVRQAVAAGATLLHGGGRVPAEVCPVGHYMEPTLMLCDRELEICRTEIFGPILPVIPFDDGDDVVAWANDCPHGLAAYVFTDSLEREHRCAADLEYGSICINEPYYSVELPHGGLKQSGMGKDCSHLSLEEYFDVKRVTTRVRD